MLFRSLSVALFLFTSASSFALASGSEAFAATVESILNRMKAEKTPEELMRFRPRDVAEFLNEQERKVLGESYLSFDVNVPSVVSVWWPAKQRNLPFWLEEQGFAPVEKQLTVEELRFQAWEKTFDAGRVGLGYSTLDGGGDHYFVTVSPAEPGAALEVSNVDPRKHTVGTLEDGARIYTDDPDSQLASVPAALAGQVLVRSPEKRGRESMLVGKWRSTSHPSHVRPDHVVLTWSDDPTTTQTVQWRAAKEVSGGQVRFRRAGAVGEEQLIGAEQSVLEDKHLINDPVCHRFTATMRGLEPDTEYEYQVGHGPEGHWTEWTTFRTAPAEAKPFRFVYMGDAQNGLDQWGRLLKSCFEKHPEAHFYIMAGDLVNRGHDRDDWDDLFHNAEGVYDRRTLVPAVGNHEMSGGDGLPQMYLDLFDLPDNGSPEIATERSYAFHYSNALFIVLDTNANVRDQTAWLEEQLANTTAKWKFVVYHHPAYASAPGRDNFALRREWTPLFDKYHVDLALQGHDHAYLRTYPMKNEKRVAEAKDGTIYIVSVSGTKFYDQDPREYTEFGMTKTATFQLLDITIEDNKLTYHAYDIDGVSKDTFVIEK